MNETQIQTEIQTKTIYEEIATEAAALDEKHGKHVDRYGGTGRCSDDNALDAHHRMAQHLEEGGRNGLTWRIALQGPVLSVYAASRPEAMRERLVKVAAMAVKWIENIDREIANR